MFDFKFEGFDEVLRKMQDLEKKLQGRIVRKAVRSGANEIKKEVVKNAKEIDDPKTPEKIWQNISSMVKRSREKGVFIQSVGVVGGAKKGGDSKKGRGGDTYYWRHLEFGTSKMKAKPFIAPAMESRAVQEKAYNKVFETIEKELLK